MLLSSGCGSGESAVAARADAAAAPARCGPVATQIVSSAVFVSPDAGQTALQTPEIAVTAADLYYEVNVSDVTPPEDGGVPSGARAGAIWRVSLDGGAPSRVADVVGGGTYGGQGFAPTADGVVFCQDGAGDPSIAVSSLDPAVAPTVLAKTHGAAGALIADDQYAYFVDAEGTKRVPLTGGDAVVLSSRAPYSLAIAGEDVILADFSAGEVLRVPKAGGATETLATIAGPLSPVGCGGSAICWLAGQGIFSGAVLRLVPGAAPAAIATGTSLAEPHALVFGGVSLYAASGVTPGFVDAVTLDPAAPDSGSAVPIASATGVADVAVDDRCVYWSSFDGIFAIAKR